jgi:chromate transporter
VALILYAAIKIAGTAIVDKTTSFIVIAGVPALFLIHPILAILLSGITGIVVIFIKRKRGSDLDFKKHKKEDSTMNPENYMWGAGI